MGTHATPRFISIFLGAVVTFVIPLRVWAG
jgi:hypothetical protein